MKPPQRDRFIVYHDIYDAKAVGFLNGFKVRTIPGSVVSYPSKNDEDLKERVVDTNSEHI